MFANALSRSAQPLGMLIFIMAIGCVFFSSAIYFAERGTWDDELGLYVRADGTESPFSVRSLPVAHSVLSPAHVWRRAVSAPEHSRLLLVVHNNDDHRGVRRHGAHHFRRPPRRGRHQPRWHSRSRDSHHCHFDQLYPGVRDDEEGERNDSAAAAAAQGSLPPALPVRVPAGVVSFPSQSPR